MTEVAERELLMASLRWYLEDLLETGVTELPFATERAQAAAGVQGVEPAVAASSAVDGGADDTSASSGALRRFGTPGPRLVFVMAGDGFEGDAGELLGKIIQAMGFKRHEVYLLAFEAGNPPSRAALCAAIHESYPEAVVALGEAAARLLLETDTPLAELRGTFAVLERAALMPTYHPEALLHDAGLKRDVWNDMQQVMRLLGQERS